MTAPGRLVTLVLCTAGGDVLGSLDAYRVELPWWNEVASVVAGCRARHGIDVVILRLLDAEGDPSAPQQMGGSVTYLAEIDGPPPPAIVPWPGTLEDDPLRARYAASGGPEAELDWALAQLAAAGRPAIAAAEQLRTWNLSSIWRIPTAAGPVWLKSVPPFFAHEGRLMLAIDSPAVPCPIATDPVGRLLLDHVAGDDRYGATGAELLAMVDCLVAIQRGWIGRTGELIDMGLPAWGHAPFVEAAADCVERTAAALSRHDMVGLERLLATCAARFDDLGSCGIPETLLHGDFHPGNLRSETGGPPVLIDWGDAGVGHPMFDATSFVDSIQPADREPVRRRFNDAWAAECPGSDPARAAVLIEPLGALRLAVTYRRFLDAIEPTEHRYHERDVPHWLTVAASLAG